MSKVENCRVSEQESGQKIISYLKRKMGRNFPDSGLMRLIRTGQVRVNKRRCKAFQRISTDDIVRIPPHQNTQKVEGPNNEPITIIFENQDFLVLEKPAGIPVHSGTRQLDTLVSRVHSKFQDTKFKPTPVHRLDKDTSGLILFAKSYSWLRRMHDIWSTPDLRKVYLAWVEGSWQDNGLKMQDKVEKKYHGVCTEEQGKTALSKVDCIVTGKDFSLLKIVIFTGRTHQIRFQLAKRGFPVVGDKKYGNGLKYGQTMLLHSYKLSWPEHDFVLLPRWKDEFNIPKKIP
ncbi:MAG: RluA family pseudouridine synthase [Desulfonatronovibrio sp. MSAO_Bac4]|nr:MAG: RluA family pseudouridine synthase [Desulfonatronovibrio sp. MSAO_Bac4]